MASTSNEIVSQRGRPKLVHDGYVYVREMTSKDGSTRFWRCQQVGACKARLHSCIDSNEVLKVIGTHSDEPNPGAIEMASRRCSLKRRAVESQSTPLQLIEDAYEGSSLAAKLVAPNPESLAWTVNRARKAERRPPAIPTSRATITIPFEYTVYQSEPGLSESFLIGDSGEGDEQRILIVVVLAEREGFVLPACYALLPNKSEDTYRRMIRIIRNAWPCMNPEAISMDFEKGLINAFSEAFPAAAIHGCLFHLVKNLKKKLTELHLMSRYRTDGNFSLSSRMIAGLAFVPPSSMDNVIAELAVFLPEELMPVLKYFEDTYVGSLRHIRPDGSVVRQEPLFPVRMWSVYERTINNDSRTNNYAEAAHKRLQTEFGVDHPSLWRLIDGLKKIQHHRDILLARYISGLQPRAKRKTYRKIPNTSPGVYFFESLLGRAYIGGGLLLERGF
ncbi:uncharacterized protein LOC108864821 [Galendromus occidentalis]|uniref:Uncharacterized protein LOC108864821 n=1 Tax=Galendromus occidentalis TaxID=34638 RepID=A0AAJ7L7Y3_9ACAR|nr:uncharacterized protein LOC108864821 [Galendromus occidentalis]